MLRQAGNSSENPERFRDEFLKFDFRLAFEACYYCTMGQQPTHGHIVNVQRPRRDGVPCVDPHWDLKNSTLKLGREENITWPVFLKKWRVLRLSLFSTISLGLLETLSGHSWKHDNAVPSSVERGLQWLSILWHRLPQDPTGSYMAWGRLWPLSALVEACKAFHHRVGGRSENHNRLEKPVKLWLPWLDYYLRATLQSPWRSIASSNRNSNIKVRNTVHKRRDSALSGHPREGKLRGAPH